MERRDKTVGTGKQNFIIFNADEEQYFELETPKPIVLSVEEALHKAYRVLRDARNTYGQGHELVSNAEQMDSVSVPIQDDLLAFSGIEGQFHMQRSDDMVEFAAGILTLCEAEVRMNLYPNANAA